MFANLIAPCEFFREICQKHLSGTSLPVRTAVRNELRAMRFKLNVNHTDAADAF